LNQVLPEPFIFGDRMPDAPLLAARGPYGVGVATLKTTNPAQPDLLNAAGKQLPDYDRELNLEVWYPAQVLPDATTQYEESLGTYGDPQRPLIPFKFLGRATRDAKPDASGGSYPLVIVSHGYVGSRYFMTYLTENLASKGYVVVAIDHPESTYRDAGPFHSTLYFRAIDQRFTLKVIERLSDPASRSFLAGLVDVKQTAIIGYSMGGYGALNLGGAGYSRQIVPYFAAQANGCTVIEELVLGTPTFKQAFDPRIKAIVTFAPWGMNHGVWDAESLAGLKVPSLIVAGSQDTISGYENGPKAIFEGITNTKAHLLTYRNARHNVASNPHPPEARAAGVSMEEYLRYADPVWDMRKMNNVNQHFVTAFLDLLLKGNEEMSRYLNQSGDSNTRDWDGFAPRTALGLSMQVK
jgi:predicted dienelactone hydrolase